MFFIGACRGGMGRGVPVGWDLQAMFRLHARSVRDALRRRGIDHDLAEDLTQDAFVRLLRLDPAEQSGAAESRAYLHRVARNLAIDHWRRESRAPFATLSPPEVERIADPAATPETRCADRQRLQIVAAALDDLPARTRRVFELHRLGGRPIAEVAAEVGLSTTRTWMLIHDAYRHIRSRLREGAVE